jgi:hypothetical protein
MKTTAKTIIVFSILSLVFFGCKKEIEPNPVENEPQNEIELCQFINVENLNQALPVINEYLKKQSNNLNDEQKLQGLVTWLKSHSCIIDASVVCISCIYTLPVQSEIIISFMDNETKKELILDISMTNPLKVVNYHENIVEVDCDCKEELFYYAFSDKIFLDKAFLNNFLLVGYDYRTQDEEIVNYINQTGLFLPVNTDDCINFSYEDKHNLLFVNTKVKHYTCSQLKEIIQMLEQSRFVAFASLTFEGYFWGGGEIQSNIMSYADEFIVKLNNGYELSDLQTLVQETNTRIIEQTQLFILLRADKNSKGNSLQMANYFYETGIFHYAHPNFLYGKVNR